MYDVGLLLILLAVSIGTECPDMLKLHKLYPTRILIMSSIIMNAAFQ